MGFIEELFASEFGEASEVYEQVLLDVSSDGFRARLTGSSMLILHVVKTRVFMIPTLAIGLKQAPVPQNRRCRVISTGFRIPDPNTKY
jgi:hypothetical protein